MTVKDWWGSTYPTVDEVWWAVPKGPRLVGSAHPTVDEPEIGGQCPPYV